jgi:hypothetical protein
MEFEFPLPKRFAPKEVVETQLVLTGYYDRYSDKFGPAVQKSPTTPKTARGQLRIVVCNGRNRFRNKGNLNTIHCG